MKWKLKVLLVTVLATGSFVGQSLAMQAWSSAQRPTKDSFNKIREILNDASLTPAQKNSAVEPILAAHKQLIRLMDSGNNTLLHYAVSKNIRKVAQTLIGLGADPDQENSKDETPLSLALGSNNEEMVNLLLGQAPVKAPVAQSATSSSSSAQQIRFIEYKDLGQLKTPYNNIIKAIEGQDVGSVATLLAAHPELIGALDTFGSSLLLKAVRTDYPYLMRLLIKKGCDVDKADVHGNTPLSFAARDGFYEMVDLLVRNGADINKTDRKMITPLASAIQAKVQKKDHPKIIQFLKDQGGIVYGHVVLKLVPKASYRAAQRALADTLLQNTISQSIPETLDSVVDQKDMHISLAYVSIPLGSGDQRSYEQKACTALKAIEHNGLDMVTAKLASLSQDHPFRWDKLKIFGKYVTVVYEEPAGYDSFIDEVYNSVIAILPKGTKRTYPSEEPPHMSLGKIQRSSQLTSDSPLVSLKRSGTPEPGLSDRAQVIASIRIPSDQDPGYTEFFSGQPC